MRKLRTTMSTRARYLSWPVALSHSLTKQSLPPDTISLRSNIKHRTSLCLLSLSMLCNVFRHVLYPQTDSGHSVHDHQREQQRKPKYRIGVPHAYRAIQGAGHDRVVHEPETHDSVRVPNQGTGCLAGV